MGITSTVRSCEQSDLSPPTEVIVAIQELISTGDRWVHVASSLQRSLSGLIIAIISGIVLGLILGWFNKFEAFIDPLLQLFRQILLLRFSLYLSCFLESEKFPNQR